MSVDTDISARFRAAVDQCDVAKIGLAVSGGGDSIAMMQLAARVCDRSRLHVVTVDHGLRPEAADEIAVVAAQADALGLPHCVLRWHWDGTGNLQAAARVGRWRAMVAWAQHAHVGAVFLGHTEDDQVETILMRLARGSGVDGLAAMSRDAPRDGMRVLRPLLDISRQDLRDWLAANGIGWCDDPSNDDTRYDRVRARQMLGHLQDLGLTRKRLLQTADHMRAARKSLQIAAREFAERHVHQDVGDLVFDPVALDLEGADVPRRVMAAALSWVGGNAYRPRFAPMLDSVARACAGHAVTLAGCVLLPQKDGTLRVTREAAATQARIVRSADLPDADGIRWDRRWVIGGPLAPDLRIAALGDGVGQCPDWRAAGMQRVALVATPAVWQGDALIAAPIAGFGNGWTARIVADFHSAAFGIED
ncbi:tRNA lysidine(34) synthetase TilS [Yoonia sp.]|uniref:tRNA lysidine(34) synthetase TilS n=1 Tax=Yoonia sp. TaxID=2212373 RepID=UPI0025FEEF36|nr:tRNA lysidine(34) synthetase TilS [Yoonia sp.]